eukprot:6785957-Pyramimonas_sp.AAC.1
MPRRLWAAILLWLFGFWGLPGIAALCGHVCQFFELPHVLIEARMWFGGLQALGHSRAVSYTHLTLPTILLV